MADTVPHNEPAELRAQSAPLLLAARAQREPEAIAYRAKHLGLYRERNWRDYASLVARCAHGFRALGLAAGERVAIMGDACEEWLLADLGAQAAGAITYGIYPTASPAELEYQMLDGGASIFVAEDQEYVDRIVPIANRLPGLRWIVVIDNSAMFDYQDARLRSFAQLLELGGTADANALERLARGIDPASPAFIVYTSGTTGHPKGALVAHGKHLAAAANLVEHYPTLTDRAHRTVAYLPMCHILGRDVAITLPLVSQLVPHFGEAIEDLPPTLFEVPTVLFAVPRYLRSSPRRCWSASPILPRSSVPRTILRCAPGASMRARAGKVQPEHPWPTRLHARQCSAPCSTSSGWTSSSCSYRAARPCRVRRWHCGRSGASTRSRSTARRRPRAASSPARAVRSHFPVASSRPPGDGR